MHRLLLLLALVGCASDDATPASLAVGQATPPPFTLEVSEMVPGQPASLTASSVNTSETAWFFLSGQGTGNGPCAPGGATCLDLLNPTMVGSASGDGTGAATLDLTVPGFLSDGTDVWFQAAVRTPLGDFFTTDTVLVTITEATSEVCLLDAVDDESTPDTARTIWLIEDSGISLFDLTLGGESAGGLADAWDTLVFPVEDGCRVDVFPTTTDDTSDIVGMVDLDGLSPLAFGDLTTASNGTGTRADAEIGLFLADTDTCFTYDLTVLYTCNDAPVVDSVSVSVEGQDTCGTWTCEATVSDADGETPSLSWSWTVDGVDVGVSGSTLDGTLVGAGDEVVCTVTATDAWGDTASGSASRTAVAADVTVERVAITAPGRQGETLTCEAEVSACVDPTLTFTWTVDGVDTGLTGDSLDTSLFATGSEIACAVSATDGTTTVDATSESLVLAPRTLTLTGGAAGRLGFGVAVMPDLDGDGYGVLAAGAPTYSEDLSYGGRLYLVDGSLDAEVVEAASVEDGTYGTVFDGLNGEYNLELLACGSAYYPGGCPTSTNLEEWEGYDAGPDGSGFGVSVRSGGDVDGDGLPDLLVSAPFELLTSIWSGRGYVISGATLGAAELADISDETSLAGFTVDAECGRRRDEDDAFDLIDEFDIINGDLAGYAMAGLGDMNGDGLADLMIGAHNAGDDNRGMAYAVYGRDDGQNVDLGDLYSFGCDGQGGTGEGSRAAELGVPLLGRSDSGLGLGSQWGWMTGAAGDFDGDGYADAVFGGRYETNLSILPGGPDGGLVDFSDGANLSDVMGWSITTTGFSIGTGDNTGAFLMGSAANGGGDFNGDGLDDVVVPMADFDFSAGLVVLFGTTVPGELPVQAALFGVGSGGVGLVDASVSYSSARSSSVIVGDMNGDGLDDAAVGFPDSNRVAVLYGRDDGVAQVTWSDLQDGTAGFLLQGSSGDAFGWSVEGGDLDGDGLADLVVGAPGESDSDAGYVEVVFGRDLTGAITDMGGPTDDTLVGTSAADHLVGGHGADELLGGGGADVLYGGAGDDLFEVDDLDFLRVRGGTGTDTLRFGAAVGDVDLTTFDAHVDDIEVLALTGQTISVPTLELLNLSTLSNQVDVTGTGTLSTVAGETWTQTGTVTEDGTTFLVLTNGRAVLRVDDALSTEIPPSVTTRALSFDENPADGSVIGAIDATDPDGSSVSFAITGGAGASDLAIDPATGELSVVDGSVFDHEDDELDVDLEITVTDGEGLTTTVDVEITVDDVNEAPVFGSEALTIGTEEGSGGTGVVIASVLATDEDAGDSFAYSLAGTDAGLFEVDVDGQITLATGATLDFETATQHVFDVVATDLAGLTDTVAVTVEVYDIDVIESQATLSLSTSNRSLFIDGGDAHEEAWGFGELMEACVSIDEGEASVERELFPPSLLGLASNLGIPNVSVTANFWGDICFSLLANGSGGDIDASLPIEVDLLFPDEVVEGSTFDVSTAWDVGEGGSVSGSQPQFRLYYYAGAVDTNWEFGYCLPQGDLTSGFSSDCSTVFSVFDATADVELDYTFGDEPWTADVASADRRTWSQSSVAFDVLEEQIPIDDALNLLLNELGLPSANDGTIEATSDLYDNTITIVGDYTVLEQEFVTTIGQSVDPVFSLDGMDARIEFEDGSSQVFDLGAGTSSLTMPSGADLDGDGDVDVAIYLLPSARVATDYRQAHAVEYSYEQYAISLTIYDANLGVSQSSSIGPVWENSCDDTFSACFAGDETYAYDIQVTGWNEPVILGAIDLATGSN